MVVGPLRAVSLRSHACKKGNSYPNYLIIMLLAYHAQLLSREAALIADAEGDQQTQQQEDSSHCTAHNDDNLQRPACTYVCVRETDI